MVMPNRPLELARLHKQIWDQAVQATVTTQRTITQRLLLSFSLGAGGGLISNFEQLVRGVWKPETNELLKMT